MPAPGDPRNRAWAAIGAAVLFSGSFLAAKQVIREVGPLTATLLRYLIALAFLIGLVVIRRERAWRMRRADRGWVALLGLSGILGYHYFFFLALRYTEAANTAVVSALSPIVTAVLAAFLLAERLPGRSYAGIALSVGGVLLLLSRGDWRRLAELRVNRGDVLMLLAVVCWAVYALIVKRLSPRYSSLTLSFGATLAGVLLLIPLALGGGGLGQIGAMSAAAWWAVLYMGVMASGAGYLLYNMSVERIGPTRTSGLVYGLVPVLVAGLSWVRLREPISGSLVASIILVLAGLQLALASPSRPVMPPSPSPCDRADA